MIIPIQAIISAFIAGSEAADIHRLQLELGTYVKCICDEMVVALFNSLNGTQLFDDLDEYNALVAQQPTLDNEELLFIQDIINKIWEEN